MDYVKSYNAAKRLLLPKPAMDGHFNLNQSKVAEAQCV
jgi:hypothetical protein